MKEKLQIVMESVGNINKQIMKKIIILICILFIISQTYSQSIYNYQNIHHQENVGRVLIFSGIVASGISCFTTFGNWPTDINDPNYLYKLESAVEFNKEVKTSLYICSGVFLLIGVINIERANTKFLILQSK